jgi:DNA polymerase-3 subunit delta
LLFVAEKADLRLRFFNLFKKHGLLLKLDPLSDKQLPSFIEAEAKRLKVELERGAAVRLADEIGADLGQLADALERLCCFVPVGQPIRIRDIEEVVVTTRQHSVFELIDAVGAADRSAALTLLAEMQMQREPALKLLALISRHVMKLWQTADLMSHGRPSPGELASALGVMPFVAGKLLDQARKLTLGRVQAMHEAIFHTDRTLKLSKLDDERIMEQLILGLCAT